MYSFASTPARRSDKAE
ncbi:unnamed protein product, partial [Adineta steineri]